MYIYYGTGKPYRYNTGIVVKDEKHWSHVEKKFKQKVTGADEMNKKLEKIRDDFKVKIEGKPLTLEIIKSSLEPEVSHTVKKTFFEEWDGWIEARANENTDGTARHRKLTKSKLEEFEKVYGTITREKITFGFLQAFANFLHKKDYAASTVAAHIKKVQTFISYLEKRDNPKISDFKVKDIQKVKVFLTEKELDLIWEKELKIKEWEVARDMYVLRCDTGLRIGDFKRLGIEHIKAGAIEMQTNKADTLTYVPLTERAISILQKYNYKLPSMLEKDHNKFIKVACKMAGINEKVEVVSLRQGKKTHAVSEKWELITTHTAVKTFITHAAKKGISVPIIAKIVGKDVQTIIDHYLGELTKEEIKIQMEKASFLKVS